MREILFRGQTRRFGEKVNMKGEKLPGNWVYGGVFHQNGRGGDFSIIYSYDPIEKHPVYADTVGQYTGLTDKNGNKIFEGDILRYGLTVDYNCYLESLEYPEEYDNRVCDQGIDTAVVVWCGNDDYPAFDLADHDFECNGLSQLMGGDYTFDVIGNIHDNPELLERE